MSGRTKLTTLPGLKAKKNTKFTPLFLQYFITHYRQPVSYGLFFRTLNFLHIDNKNSQEVNKLFIVSGDGERGGEDGESEAGGGGGGGALHPARHCTTTESLLAGPASPSGRRRTFPRQVQRQRAGCPGVTAVTWQISQAGI